MERSRITSFRQRRLLQRKRRGNIKTFFWLIVFVIIGIFYYSITYHKDVASIESSVPETGGEVAGTAISQISEISDPEPKPSVSPSPIKPSKSLQEAVEKSLEGTQGDYGVVVKNLKTGESFSVNESRSFEAGSLYKLWTMAVVFNKIESGELSEDMQLSQGIDVLNRKFSIDPELAEQTQGTITLSVKDALNQMITISHNYAALLLTEKIKLSTVASYLENNGFKDSKVGTDGSAPTTTPLEIARFFEKLYKGELGNKESTAKMMDLLKNQQLNNKLPKNLPPGVVIAHKTGELGWFSHDAGIVYLPKGDYIIVIMSESTMPAAAEERIAQLSRDVFNYFNK